MSCVSILMNLDLSQVGSKECHEQTAGFDFEKVMAGLDGYLIE